MTPASTMTLAAGLLPPRWQVPSGEKSMELLAHLTYNEVVVSAMIYLLGMVSGLAVAWKFGRN